MSDRMRAIWRRLAPGLIANGMLTQRTRASFKLLVVAEAEVLSLRERVEEDGCVVAGPLGIGRQVHPLLSELGEYEILLRESRTEWGLLPDDDLDEG